MRIIVPVLLILPLFFAPIAAHSEPMLFGSHAYGTPRSEIEALDGVEHGEGSMEEDLILPNVPWLGKRWTAQFRFAEDKLAMVSLLGAYEGETFKAVREQLASDNFEIFGIVVDEKALDLFTLVKAEGVESFQKRFMEVMREKTPERVSYEYFQTKGVSDDQKTMAGSIDEFLRIVDMSIVHAEVTQLGDGSGGPQALIVAFTCPVLNSVGGAQK